MNVTNVICAMEAYFTQIDIMGIVLTTETENVQSSHP